MGIRTKNKGELKTLFKKDTVTSVQDGLVKLKAYRYQIPNSFVFFQSDAKLIKT